MTPDKKAQALAAMDDWPTDPDLILVRRYIAGYLSEADERAVELRLASDQTFLMKVGPILSASRALQRERRLRERRGGVPWTMGAIEQTLAPEARAIVAERATLLTASLTEHGAVSLAQLVTRAGKAAGESETDGWLWIAAVRRVQMDAHLTSRHADALVMHIAKRLPRFASEGPAMLRKFGEREIAESVQLGGEPYEIRMVLELAGLVHMADDATGRWLVDYPEWTEDDAAAAPLRDLGAWSATYEDESIVQALVEEWRIAALTGDRDDLLTRLTLDCLEATQSLRLGVLSLVAIRRCSGAGVVSEDFSWLVADMVAKAMVKPELETDSVLDKIRLRLGRLEAAGDGPDDAKTPWLVVGASGEWRVLDAARERRIALFQRRVLRAAGWEEAAGLMRADLGEWRRRVNEVRREWNIRRNGPFSD